MSDILANSDWDTLAHMLRTIETGIEGEDARSKRLRAKLGIVRQILSEEMREWNGSGTIELSLLIATFKTVRGLEKDFEAAGVKKRDFLVFLKLILTKFERQKIKAKKPLAMISEFRKMKGVVENGHAPI